MADQTIIHLVAGGIAGTAGAIVTCPLDVVKTRLQSSVATFRAPAAAGSLGHLPCPAQVAALSTYAVPAQQQRVSLVQCLRHIKQTEGMRALFKGLGPNIVGVAPTRAIYFYAYAQSKRFLCDRMQGESHAVHVLSAAAAGFSAATATNPLWVVKTRLQLDQRKPGHLRAVQCVRRIYAQDGLSGFYRGITASYFGISETVIHFAIYETIKQKLAARRAAALPAEGGSGRDLDGLWGVQELVEPMLAGATSRLCASLITYPHEVARTRMRQEGSKYRSFVKTLVTVCREEGWRGAYSGLFTQLVRTIPNTAIVMSCYELVVRLLGRPAASAAEGDLCGGAEDYDDEAAA